MTRKNRFFCGRGDPRVGPTRGGGRGDGAPLQSVVVALDRGKQRAMSLAQTSRLSPELRERGQQ